MTFNYILRSIFALLLIIWLANVLLGKLSKYTQGQAKSIQIIERFSISKQSSLAIVKVINDYYLMSFNESSNEILKEFAADEVEVILEIMQNRQDKNEAQIFSEIDFTKMKAKYAKFFKKDQE